MARTKIEEAPVISEYERLRDERLAANKAIMQEAMGAAAAGLAAAAKKAPKISLKQKIKPTKGKENYEPARKSLRIRNIKPENEVAKRKFQEEHDQILEKERALKRRKSGDLDFSDILTSGSWDGTGNFLRGVAPARPNVRTFDPEEAKKSTDKDFKKAMASMSSLTLWENLEPNSLKLTHERVYALTFHPTTSKALVFAGDKLGNLGIFDSAESQFHKQEGDDDEGEWNLAISQIKLHTRTISALEIRESDPTSVYSASYDSTIRKFDLEKGIATEIFAPYDDLAEEGISNIQLVESEPHMVYFTTLDGRFGVQDIRIDSKSKNDTELYTLSEKKIGGFSIHPSYPHLLATASLDRTLKLWDLRKITGKGYSRLPHLIGEHESRLSVSSASFNHLGQVATSSYDDTVKLYDFGKCATASAGSSLTEEEMKPTVAVRHNNQTGRWVTILKPRWQMTPQDSIQKFCIGSMDRFIDIYDAKGRQLAQLGGNGITAVPAVAQIHPTLNWVAGGTASGKLCLFV